MYRFVSATHILLNSSLDMSVYLINKYNLYEDDLQLGKLKENYFATQALSQTQKNVSEPQKHTFLIVNLNP